MGTCHNSTCTNPIFSHGFCKYHQNLRTDSKYLQKKAEQLSRKFHPVKKIVRNINFGFRNEVDMFHTIWNERRHVCEFTGESLEQFYGTDLWYSCFAHILPKGKFPLFKLNADNIRLVFPDFHTTIDQGTQKDRLKHPDWDFKHWDELVQKMKNEYVKFQKDNLLS